MLDTELPLAAAAFTCISRTYQYPLGSAQPGIGCRAAAATAGLAFFSAAFSACGFPAVAAELTAATVVTIPFPCPCVQARYCSPQLAGTRTTVLWLAGAAAGAGLLPPQAVSPAAAAAAATMRMMRFKTCSVHSVAPGHGVCE